MAISHILCHEVSILALFESLLMLTTCFTIVTVVALTLASFFSPEEIFHTGIFISARLPLERTMMCGLLMPLPQSDYIVRHIGGFLFCKKKKKKLCLAIFIVQMSCL